MFWMAFTGVCLWYGSNSPLSGGFRCAGIPVRDDARPQLVYLGRYTGMARRGARWGNPVRLRMGSQPIPRELRAADGRGESNVGAVHEVLDQLHPVWVSTYTFTCMCIHVHVLPLVIVSSRLRSCCGSVNQSWGPRLQSAGTGRSAHIEKALYPHCSVPRNGLKAVGPIDACL